MNRKSNTESHLNKTLVIGNTFTVSGCRILDCHSSQDSRFFRHLKGFKILTSQVSILSNIMKDICHQEKKTKQRERHKTQRSKERVVAYRGTKGIPRTISEDSKMQPCVRQRVTSPHSKSTAHKGYQRNSRLLPYHLF